MADRNNYQGPTFGTRGAPVIHVQQSGVDFASMISNSFKEALAVEEEKADRAAQLEGKTAGAEAAKKGDLRSQDWATLRGSAHNQALLSTRTNMIETDASLKMRELSEEFWDNPEGFRNASQAYINGVSGQLSGVDLEVSEAVRSRLTLKSGPIEERIKDQLTALVVDRSNAASIRHDAAIEQDLDDLAGDLFSSNPDQSSKAWSAIKMMEADRLARFNELGPDGRPIYTEVQKENAQQQFFERIFESAMTHWVRDAEDLGDVAEKFMSGDLMLEVMTENGPDQIDISRALQPDARKRVQGLIEGELSFRNSSAREQERAEKAELDKLKDDTLFALTAVDAGLDPNMPSVNLSDLIDLQEQGLISADDARPFLESISEQINPPDETDPDVTDYLAQNLYYEEGDPKEIMQWMVNQKDRMSTSDYQKWMKTLHASANSEVSESKMNSEQRFYFQNLRTALVDGFWW